MGGSSSKDSTSTDDETLQQRMRQIIEEESKKKNASREAQAANDERIKNLMRDVLKEEDGNKNPIRSKSSSHNVMLMGILQEILESRRTNADKSKIINHLLDLQQKLGSVSASGDSTYLAQFIEKQLLELQSTQDVKITVEKKASGAATPSAPSHVAEPSATSGGARTSLWEQGTDFSQSHFSTVDPRPLPAFPQSSAPPVEPRTYNNGALQEPSKVAKPFGQNIFPNPQSTFKDNGPFHDTSKDSKAHQQNYNNNAQQFKDNGKSQNFSTDEDLFQQKNQPPPIPAFPNPRPKYNESKLYPNLSAVGEPVQQDFSRLPPPIAPRFPDPLNNPKQFPDVGQYAPKSSSGPTNKNQQFMEKQVLDKERFKQNAQPQNNLGHVEKNQRKQAQDHTWHKNNKQGYDNGPFLDKGPMPKNKDEGCKVEQNRDGSFHVKVPPPLLGAFSNTGKYANNRQDRPQNRGRGSHHPDRFHANDQYQAPRPYCGLGDPHQDQNDGLQPFPPPIEGYFRGLHQENFPHPGNQRGGFQYRGNGPRRPFPNRGQGFCPRENRRPGAHEEFMPDPGFGQLNLEGRHFDLRQEQRGSGNHHPRMPRADRGNNSNRHPRSFSQPRTRHQGEFGDNKEKDGGQETGRKQGYKGHRGFNRGQGAVPKPRYFKNKKQQGAWSAEPQNDADDSDNDSVKTDVSTKTDASTKSNSHEAMGEVNFGIAVAAGEETKKKKTRKPKKKTKKASSATNLSFPQNDGVEDSQSQSDYTEGVTSTGELEEASAPLGSSTPMELLVGALNHEALENLSPDRDLGQAVVVIVKVEDAVRSYHPATVGELAALKKKYPNAEVIVVR